MVKVCSINYKDIKLNMYTVDEYGNVYSLFYKKYMKPQADKDGYLKMGFTFTSTVKTTKRRYVRIATLVAYHFIGSHPLDMQDPTINHKDGNILNNHYSNLEWMERAKNSSIRMNKPSGEKNGSVILTEVQVKEICKLLLDGLTLSKIGLMYGVDKSTISNIKRKKSWAYLTKDIQFSVHEMKNKEDSKKQRAEILKLLAQDYTPRSIIKMGYPYSVVYRQNKFIYNK